VWEAKKKRINQKNEKKTKEKSKQRIGGGELAATSVEKGEGLLITFCSAAGQREDCAFMASLYKKGKKGAIPCPILKGEKGKEW